MKKLYFTSLFILFFSIGFSQSYPYLNASTANENEFPVDKDTNIYMFHGNRLVKTDKNFNVIWAKTYTGINSFKRLLLSKTGSLFCAGTYSLDDCFGKINSDGSVAWLKRGNINALWVGNNPVSYDFSCYKLFLDRNNDLVVTGESGYGACFIKLDTNGNVLKYKVFNTPTSGNSYCDKFSIIADSAGYYKFIGSGYSGMGPQRDLGIYYYSDNLDIFTKVERLVSLGNPTSTYFDWKLITSKFTDRFYVQNTLEVSSAPIISGVIRLSMAGKPKWSGIFSNFHGTPHAFMGHLEESNTGDLFYGLSTGNFLSNYTSAFMKIDSNGVAGSLSAKSMLYNYPLGFVQPPNHASRIIHNGSYYFDISGQFFSNNPLTIQKFNSSMSYVCSSSVSVTYNNSSVTSFTLPASFPPFAPIVSFNIPVHTSSTTNVSFSVNTNFCTVLGVENVSDNISGIEIYPNPASDKLHISEKNYSVNSVEVFDVNGKNIKSIANDSSIDVSNLPNGIYFIRIKTDKGDFNKKFIKE
jgi:hypothetical protein